MVSTHNKAFKEGTNHKPSIGVTQALSPKLEEPGKTY